MSIISIFEMLVSSKGNKVEISGSDWDVTKHSNTYTTYKQWNEQIYSSWYKKKWNSWIIRDFQKLCEKNVFWETVYVFYDCLYQNKLVFWIHFPWTFWSFLVFTQIHLYTESIVAFSCLLFSFLCGGRPSKHITKNFQLASKSPGVSPVYPKQV